MYVVYVVADTITTVCICIIAWMSAEHWANTYRKRTWFKPFMGVLLVAMAISIFLWIAGYSNA